MKYSPTNHTTNPLTNKPPDHPTIRPFNQLCILHLLLLQAFDNYHLHFYQQIVIHSLCCNFLPFMYIFVCVSTVFPSWCCVYAMCNLQKSFQYSYIYNGFAFTNISCMGVHMYNMCMLYMCVCYYNHLYNIHKLLFEILH